MLPARASRTLSRHLSLPICSRTVIARRQSTSSSSSSGPSPKYEAPGPTPSNKHREFYKSFGLPITKIFLGALFTYQALYWGWLKLESVEDQAVFDAEAKRLGTAIKGLKDARDEAPRKR